MTFLACLLVLIKLLITSSRTSSTMAGKKIQNGRFIVIFRILRQ